MATFLSDQFPAGYNAPIGVHGEFKTVNRIHAIVAVTTAMTTNDVLNVGFLPPNAVVTAVRAKAPTQLDSNGAPTLTLSLGVTGTAALFQSALTTVGRAAGASTDATIAAAGALFKNGASKVLVIGTCANVAATAVAGTLEYLIDYFVEE